jgi:hypothetical protein
MLIRLFLPYFIFDFYFLQCTYVEVAKDKNLPSLITLQISCWIPSRTISLSQLPSRNLWDLQHSYYLSLSFSLFISVFLKSLMLVPPTVYIIFTYSIVAKYVTFLCCQFLLCLHSCCPSYLYLHYCCRSNLYQHSYCQSHLGPSFFLPVLPTVCIHPCCQSYLYLPTYLVTSPTYVYILVASPTYVFILVASPTYAFVLVPSPTSAHVLVVCLTFRVLFPVPIPVPVLYS